MNVKEQPTVRTPKFVNTESYTWVFGIKGNIPTLYDTLFLAETRNVGFSPYLQIQLCPPYYTITETNILSLRVIKCTEHIARSDSLKMYK